MSRFSLSVWRREFCSLTAAAALIAGGGANAQTAPNTSFNLTPTADRLESFVAEAAGRFDIPSAWIRAVMRAESGGFARVQSPKGAMGLMQIMPRTWSDLHARYNLGADPFDPHDNILAGTAYLRELFDRYGHPGFLAAYNAGPGRWEDQLAGRRTLPVETMRYVARLAPMVSGGADRDRPGSPSTRPGPPAIPSIFALLTSRQTAATAIPEADLWPAKRIRIVVAGAPVRSSGGLFVARTPTDPDQ